MEILGGATKKNGKLFPSFSLTVFLCLPLLVSFLFLFDIQFLTLNLFLDCFFLLLLLSPLFGTVKIPPPVSAVALWMCLDVSSFDTFPTSSKCFLALHTASPDTVVPVVIKHSCGRSWTIHEKQNTPFIMMLSHCGFICWACGDVCVVWLMLNPDWLFCKNEFSRESCCSAAAHVAVARVWHVTSAAERLGGGQPEGRRHKSRFKQSALK